MLWVEEATKIDEDNETNVMIDDKSIRDKRKLMFYT